MEEEMTDIQELKYTQKRIMKVGWLGTEFILHRILPRFKSRSDK